ncbi:hypothetical protein [Erwinia sp.]|uniref:hypothetical protein n=1 Tax=Erwinia citreus TaxID=558 RepID=UPI00289F1BCD|nr:hypothetical protein [Erwinia sp.]
MAIIVRPFIRGLLFSLPLYVMGSSPWTVTEDSTRHGATQNVNPLLLNSASSWLVTADSNLNRLALFSAAS